MKKSITIILFTILVSFAFAQDKPAYKLFNKDGESTKYIDMINQLKDADLVFLVNYITILLLTGYSLK